MWPKLKGEDSLKKQINDRVSSLKNKEMLDLVKQENVYTGHVMTEIHASNAATGKKNNILKTMEENTNLDALYSKLTRQQLLILRQELFIL